MQAAKFALSVDLPAFGTATPFAGAAYAEDVAVQNRRFRLLSTELDPEGESDVSWRNKEDMPHTVAP